MSSYQTERRASVSIHSRAIASQFLILTWKKTFFSYTNGVGAFLANHQQITTLVSFNGPFLENLQSGFMKSKRTTDAIFIVIEMQESFKVKEKKLYLGFVDLQKNFW